MGLLIFLLYDIYVSGSSLASHAAELLNPLGRLFGLDGVILISFILGIPANEIVVPIMLTLYVGSQSREGATALSEIFLVSGWTVKTAICCAVFALFHFPCSTTLITVYKETKSVKYTFLAFFIPTFIGLLFCFVINLLPL
jgi:ferrous iron transport protein B